MTKIAGTFVDQEAPEARTSQPEQTGYHNHANRLYAVLSAVNRTIIRKLGRDELLPEICRILVEVGEFRLARVGIPDALARSGRTPWP